MQKLKHKKYKKEFADELEGAHHISKRSTSMFHPDSSVRVCHDSQHSSNECECFDNCECYECEICEYCESSTDSCDCDDCLRCVICYENVEVKTINNYHIDTGCRCFPLQSHINYMVNIRDIRCYLCKELTDSLCDMCNNVWRSDNIDTEHHCEQTSSNCNQECSCRCRCVDDDDDDPSDPDLNYCCDGEVVSPVYKRLSSLIKWTDINYPVKTNPSCGGHLHVSFNTDMSLYSKLIVPEFTDELIKHLHKFGVENKVNPNSSLFKRLKGGCDYALISYNPEHQLFSTEKGSSRYTAVNYCWGLHRTIEIRVLPAFQKKYLYINMLKSIDEFIDRFLESKEHESQDIGVSF